MAAIPADDALPSQPNMPCDPCSMAATPADQSNSALFAERLDPNGVPSDVAETDVAETDDGVAETDDGWREPIDEWELLGRPHLDPNVWIWISRAQFGQSPMRGTMSTRCAHRHFDAWYRRLLQEGKSWRLWRHAGNNSAHRTDCIRMPTDMPFHPDWEGDVPFQVQRAAETSTVL